MGGKYFVWKCEECTEKNQLQPHLKRQWCIRQLDGKFLWQMEQILQLYALPYNPDSPVVCFDERPCHLLEEVVQPIPMQPGKPQRRDYHYQPKGQAQLLMAFEPHTGQRWAKVYPRKSKHEYTQFMAYLAQQFPQAKRILLIQDNLNTHHPGSFYNCLPAQAAFALTQRFQMHYTPIHASWLNMIEIEFSILAKQCLDRRIADIPSLFKEVKAWLQSRNLQRATVHWQFTTLHAREKFAKYYGSNII